MPAEVVGADLVRMLTKTWFSVIHQRSSDIEARDAAMVSAIRTTAMESVNGWREMR